MKVTSNIKHAICAAFDVHEDAGGIQRVVTPMEYAGVGDKIVVRVRPFGDGWRIDENGEAAFYASMAGADLESETVSRWLQELPAPVIFDKDETLLANTNDARLVVPYIFRVADAAQQLHAIATARTDRAADDFKAKVAKAIHEVAEANAWAIEDRKQLPIQGGFEADHYLQPNDAPPLIVVTASSNARLLEAELIYMAYRQERKPGKILAVVKSQEAVTKKQFERSGYYTDKAVVFQPGAMSALLPAMIQ